jgi:hypothetical protein
VSRSSRPSSRSRLSAQAIASATDDPYMFVSDSNLAGQLAALGNVPRDHQGDCLVRLPGGGQHTVATASVQLFTEGVIGQLPDGRRERGGSRWPAGSG